MPEWSSGGALLMYTVRPDGSGINPADARTALEEAVSRVTHLIRTIAHPDVPALGVWNTGEVAVHLAHAWEVLPSLARGESASPLGDPLELADMTRSLVSAEEVTDPAAAAGRIDAAASAFFELLDDHAPDETMPWIVRGVGASLVTFTGHLLNETLVHGYDIARAQRASWPIRDSDAALVLFGFLFPQVMKLDPRSMVVQERAAGLRACYEIRVRRAGRMVLMLDDGALSVDPRPEPEIDFHISANASSLFLVLWNRIGQHSAFLRGQMFGWGRRPLLGFKLRSLLRNP